MKNKIRKALRFLFLGAEEYLVGDRKKNQTFEGSYKLEDEANNVK